MKGKERPPNLTVVVMDNGIYENIGGPPTHTSANTDLARMASGAGCVNCHTSTDLDDFETRFRAMMEDNQMGYLVAKIERSNATNGNGRTASQRMVSRTNTISSGTSSRSRAK